MERLILNTSQCPGDVVMLTAAVRDLHAACPGRFETDVRTAAPALWEHNPHLTPLDERDPQVRTIEMHYPLIHHSNQRPYHFLHGYVQFLEDKLNVRIPVRQFHGDVHLSAGEKQTRPSCLPPEVPDEFWIVVAGGKHDFTAKWWNPQSFQSVVDHFGSELHFVQCGAADDWHPPLDGVTNLIGKTTLREFVQLMHWAAGVVCHVTFAMHLAAAVETRAGQRGARACVVIAGGRESPHWEAYPTHQFISTVGSLACCKTGGCWKSRCHQVGDGDQKDRRNLCERPVRVSDQLCIPECMEMIRPEDVIRRIEYCRHEINRKTCQESRRPTMTLVHERGFWIRPDNREQDLVIVEDIVERDAYRLNDLNFDARVVVDVGAHIGCFSRLAHGRFPTARIVAIECCRENIEALERNVGQFAHVLPAALTYERDVAVLNAVFPNCRSTGGSAVLPRAELLRRIAYGKLLDHANGQHAGEYWADLRALPTWTLEDVMSKFDLPCIDVLKLDCEGSEFSILENTTSLDRIRAIVGEYHGRERFLELVARRLSEWQFDLLQDGNLGLFRLTNPKFCNVTSPSDRGISVNAEQAAAHSCLIKFRHGLGDAVQLTSVLRHLRTLRPDWAVDVAALRGKHSALFGLCRQVFVLRENEPPESDYDAVFNLDWHECHECRRDTPSTKVERCLEEVFGISPQPELCGYEIQTGEEAQRAARRYLARVCADRQLPDGRFPVVLIHYQGNTSAEYKNLPHELVAELCEQIIQRGFVPVILDWDRRSPLPDGNRIHCPDANHVLWRGAGTGDAEALAALIEAASLMVGIDSGPLHVAAATTTPTCAVWTRHHPVHYLPPAANVTHFVPMEHTALLRGKAELGLAYFEEAYRHETYQCLSELINRLAARVNDAGPICSQPRIVSCSPVPAECDPDDESPIFIAGIPRSGTTWLQWFLSQHPDIHVHGQFPNLHWPDIWDWYESLHRAGAWAVAANAQLDYEVPHYAGSSPDDARLRFRQFLRDFLTGLGPSKRIWGVKSLRFCLDTENLRQIEALWPRLRWIVCIRDPFRSIASEKNTFRPDVDVHMAARTWIDMCRFAAEHDPRRTHVFQIDRLGNTSDRVEATGQLLQVLGLAHTEATRQAATEFTVIHKVRPDADRDFHLDGDDMRQLLEDIPELSEWCRKMGYEVSELDALKESVKV